MLRKLVEIALVVAVAMLPAGAEELNQSWDKLSATVEPGTKITVTTMIGKNFTGELISVTSDSVTVKTESRMRYSTNNEIVPSKDVLRVRLVGSKRTRVLIAMAIPAVLFGAAEYTVGGRNGAVGGAGGGAMWGGLIGAAVLPRPMQTLYEASSESRTVWLKDHKVGASAIEQ